MSLLDTIKSWARRAWWAVRNFFTDDTYGETVADDTNEDSWKQTLNQQIENWNINLSGNVNDVQPIITPSGFKELAENSYPETTMPDAPQEPASQVVKDDEDADSFLSRLWNWFSAAADDVRDVVDDTNELINGMVNSRRAKADYNNQEEMYAVGYNPDNRNVYYLDLNEERGFFDWDFWTHEWVKNKFEQLLWEYDRKSNLPWATYDDQVQAYMDFYNEAKKLFRIRADDRYTDWLFWQTSYWRRDELFTQDELDYLASTGKTTKQRYEPTPDEFSDFVAMYLRNLQTQKNLWIEYSSDTETIEIPSETQEMLLDLFNSEAMKGIDEYFEPMDTVNPRAAMDAKLSYEANIVNWWGTRVYNHLAPIFRAETEILNRDSSTWSWQDRYLLWKANNARELLKTFGRNTNDLLRQTLLYGTNKKWNIVDTPDIFENWESLNDVLTKWLREIAGEDRHWYSEHESYIDIIEKFSNDALYIYNQDKAGPLKQAWNEVEYFFHPLGTTLWEVWQATWALWMDAVWGISMGLLYDWLTKSYMDQDATAFRLMETDDGNIGRSVKKYYLDVTEYTPEIVGNLGPDVAAYFLTWPGALATTVRHFQDISRTYKVVKAAEWASLLNKLRVLLLDGLKWEETLQRLWMTASKYNEIINATKAAPKIKYYQTLKTWAELLDRAITQAGLWQIMDAQWSAYDTEPYSQASFLMSVIGSAAFDLMPDLFRLATWRWWFKVLTGRFWDNIWSLSKYIDSSEEAAKNVARILRKWTWEISVDDLKTFAHSFWAIEEAAKKAYNWLTEEQKKAIGRMTKTMMYSYVNQAFWSNSTIGKRIRQILQNENTNVADVIKYLWNIPWDVELWPYVSTIKFKNWTRADIYAKGKTWEYTPILDSLFNWWFDRKISEGFSQADLDRLSEVPWFKNIESNKAQYFNKIEDENWIPTYYLNEKWLNRFWLKAESITLESLWISLKDAENSIEALNKIKWAEWVNISQDTIEYLAHTWGYEEITLKVKEVLWC